MSAPRRSVALVFPGCHRLGGVERVVRELARRLVDGHDVSFVGDRFDPAGMDGVRWVPTAGRPLPDVAGLVAFHHRAGQALARHPHDVVVSFGAECPPGDLAVVGSVHRAWLAQPGDITTRVGRLPAWSRRLLPHHQARLALERRYFASPRPRLLATSATTAAEVTTWYGVDPARIEVQPNGFDPTEFDRSARAGLRAAQRAALDLDDDQVVVLFVANELHRKGFATLVEAAAQVDDPRLRIDVVGRVSPEAFAPQIESGPLAGRVHWHGPQPDVAPWYAAGDLLVLPTRYEPFGNVVVEALALGTPVITSRLAGAAPAVQPGRSGLLLDDPTDARALAQALETALAPGVLARWSAETAEGVAPYDWDVVAAAFAERVDAVATQPPRP